MSIPATSWLTRQSLLVAGVCLTVDVLAFMAQGGLRAGNGPWLAVLVIIVLADAALATPTRWSGLVAGVSVGVNALGATLLADPTSLDLNEAGMLVASYRAGAWLRGPQAVAALGVVVTGLVLAHLARGHALDWAVLLQVVKFGVVSWLVGRYTTARRAYLDELRRRAEHEERDALEAVERAVTEDRAAIARDLHDVVTHHVSAINVHAGAARLRLSQGDGDPAALASLRSVEDASRSALGDLRDLLDLLHGRRSPAQPGLNDLDDLLHGFRAASIPVRLEITGTPRALPVATDTALYRVVQEMLTNALRHGDPGAITVAVRFTDGAVEVETINPYRPTGTPGDAGRGLAGIRNRVTPLGGRVRSGPLPDGRAWSTAVRIEPAAVHG